MRRNTNQKTRSWQLVAGFVFLIYSTLYIVRPICNFLKQTLPFPAIVNIVLIMMLVVLTVFMCQRKKRFTSLDYWLAGLVLGGYGMGLIVIEYPEEKIHFIEYGVLSFLIFRALRYDFHLTGAYLGAFLLTSLVGWGDEGIQALLPNRYYQLQDVILNSISGVLGLMSIFIFQRK